MEDLYFNFYEVVTKLSVSPADIDDALFYFGNQRIAPTGDDQVEVHVSLQCAEWPERGFFESLLRKDGLSKRISLAGNDGSGWRKLLDHSFTGWSDVPTPLPPFRHSSLWTTHAVGAGCCLRLANGVGVLLTGHNYVGKTATALALCGRGARLVSDSIAILDLKSGEFKRHDSPLGFRRENRRANMEKILAAGYRETVSPDTGLVLLCRPQDFLGMENLGSVQVGMIVLLARKSGNGNTRVYRRATEAMGWFSGAERKYIQKLLPSETTVLEFSETATPDELADAILDLT